MATLGPPKTDRPPGVFDTDDDSRRDIRPAGGSSDRLSSAEWARRALAEADDKTRGTYAMYAGQNAFDEGLSVDANPFDPAAEPVLHRAFLAMFEICAKADRQLAGGWRDRADLR
ncbi:MAG: hypothetical protein U1A72_16945 [Sulfuritalea sp.]|nr:hypothetical protein [Sulfuritalea sp.]